MFVWVHAAMIGKAREELAGVRILLIFPTGIQ